MTDLHTPPDIDPAVFETGRLGEVLGTMDSVLQRHGEELVFEVAETTYHDMARGITDFSEMFFYIDRSLEDLHTSMYSSFFKDLEQGHTYYRLQGKEGDVTIHVRFGLQHAESERVPTEHEAIEFRVPTLGAVLSELSERLAEQSD